MLKTLLINIQQIGWKWVNDAIILDHPIPKRNQFKILDDGIALHFQENLLQYIGTWLAILKSLFGQVVALTPPTPPGGTVLYCVCVWGWGSQPNSQPCAWQLDDPNLDMAKPFTQKSPLSHSMCHQTKTPIQHLGSARQFVII